jgi:hypothetical protein
MIGARQSERPDLRFMPCATEKKNAKYTRVMAPIRTVLRCLNRYLAHCVGLSTN